MGTNSQKENPLTISFDSRGVRNAQKRFNLNVIKIAQESMLRERDKLQAELEKDDQQASPFCSLDGFYPTRGFKSGGCVFTRGSRITLVSDGMHFDDFLFHFFLVVLAHGLRFDYFFE
jgi:hypothetical protein